MSQLFDNPTPDELRAFTEEMPETRISGFGNVNVQTTVLSRSAASTYVVDRESSGKTMTRADYEKVAAAQDAYIAEHDMLVIDGYIGNDPEFRAAARLIIEKATRTSPACSRSSTSTRDRTAREPEVQRDLHARTSKAEGYPDDRLIAVDLDNYSTRVLNSDYFGESKKGGLRMWNNIVYDSGGLALHAGLQGRSRPTAGRRSFMIVGLSGTGKTTTTFTKQNNSRPVQDDFVGADAGRQGLRHRERLLRQDVRARPRLRADDLRRRRQAHAYLENVSQDDERQGRLLRRVYTQNGRAVFRMERHRSRSTTRASRTVDYLLILNRNENIIPAVAKLNGAGRRVLHARRDEGHQRGRRRRGGQVAARAGHEPVLPAAARPAGQPHAGAAETHPMEVYLMNTGRVGGEDERRPLEESEDPALLRRRERHRRGTIKWTRTPTSATRWRRRCPSIDDGELLQPRRLYERAGPRGGVPRDRGAVEERAGDAPATVHAAVRRHHQGRRLTPIVTTREAGARPRSPRVPHLSMPRAPRGTTPRAAASRRARGTR